MSFKWTNDCVSCRHIWKKLTPESHYPLLQSDSLLRPLYTEPVFYVLNCCILQKPLDGCLRTRQLWIVQCHHPEWHQRSSFTPSFEAYQNWTTDILKYTSMWSGLFCSSTGEIIFSLVLQDRMDPVFYFSLLKKWDDHRIIFTAQWLCFSIFHFFVRWQI